MGSCLRTKRGGGGRTILPGRHAVIRFAGAAALLLAFAGISASPAGAAQPVSHTAYGTGLVVGLDRPMPLGQRHALTAGLLAGGKPLAPGIRFLDVPHHRVPVKAQRIRQHAGVRYAEPNYVMHAAAAPNDPSFALQWPLENTGQTVNGITGLPG